MERAGSVSRLVFLFFRDMIPVEFGFKENDNMQCTNTIQQREELAARERAAFSKIPGMSELLQSSPEKREDMECRYPDAAFALMVADHLSMGNREQNAIHQKAYLSILGGESIQNVRFRYDYDLEQYLERHMWD